MLQNLKSFSVNFRPPFVKGRYVVFESDDWGTIRMSSHKAIRQLREKGSPVDQSAYARIDALECDEDILMLYDVLRKYKGGDGRPAKFTFNNILGNPDFDAIRKSGFNEYYWEPFRTTLERYPAHGQVWDLYQDGLREGLIQVQFHGKEHVNVERWMKDLQQDRGLTRFAFDLGLFSHPEPTPPRPYWNEHMDAYGIETLDENKDKAKSIREGLLQFSETWGFNSDTLIAPCYVWHRSLEETMHACGVKGIQGILYQFEPGAGQTQQSVRHHFGQRNQFGQRYLVRNASFEPFVDNGNYWVDRCLAQIRMAFICRKPAIISVHRANFTGFLDPGNRKENLRRLDELLNKIVQRWPDVNFVGSDEILTLLN